MSTSGTTRRRGRRCGALLLAGAWLGALPPGAVAAAAPGSGSWRATAAPSTPRTSDHTATLLADGRVLVAGGIAAGDASKAAHATAEIYDPPADRWSPAGPMAHARQYHRATGLAGGGVLVTGGYLDAGLVAATEVFDPATGAFGPSGPLAEGRIGHSATLLGDGRVLVAGGLVFGPDRRLTFATSAELYDPATGAWTAAAPLPAARAEHAATLLADGKVLVTGGQGDSGRIIPALRDALVYDPAAGTWAPVPRLMHTGRAAHTATLLEDGTVLVAGGSVRKEHGGGGQPTADVELYDPVAGTFVPGPPLTDARLAHSATVLADGTVLVVGGVRAEDERRRVHPVASAERYDPARRRWAPAASPTVPPASAANRDMRVWMLGGHHSTTVLSGRACGARCGQVLVVGGDGPGGAAQLFDPRADPAGTGAGGRGGVVAGAALAGGLVLLAGGWMVARSRRPARAPRPRRR